MQNTNPNKKEGKPKTSLDVTKEKADAKRESWRKHKNPAVRYFAKFSYTVWLVVMAIGVSLALVIALMLL